MKTHERHVDVIVDSDRIDGTLVAPGVEIPGVLFVHGWGATQQQYLARAREVAALGFVCLTLDLSGHARTVARRETVSRERNLRDVLGGYEILAAHPQVDRERIAVVGSSYGGYLVAILSELRPVRWLGLRAPALYRDAGWELPKLQLHREQDLVAYRRSFVPAAENRALRACARFRGDVLIVESEHDELIPRPVIASYRAACTEARSLTYRCIRGADHALSSASSQQEYTRSIVQWFSEMLADARSAVREPAQTIVADPGGVRAIGDSASS
ncbi:MAG TPA: alpha/beta fold hydrolase [Zeimonas sp.]|jgi:dienelactone hydrolase|nr:alpha/beta fold hydrolase [Zeimonas sp.]